MADKPNVAELTELVQVLDGRVKSLEGQLARQGAQPDTIVYASSAKEDAKMSAYIWETQPEWRILLHRCLVVPELIIADMQNAGIGVRAISQEEYESLLTRESLDAHYAEYYALYGQEYTFDRKKP